MKKFLIVGAIMLSSIASAKEYNLISPDGKIAVNIESSGTLSYEVLYKDKMLIETSPIYMTFNNGKVIGKEMKVKKVVKSSGDRILTPVVRQKSETLTDKYNEITLSASGYDVIFRAYDEGVAYRFETYFKDSVTVLSEQSTFAFADDFLTVFPEEKSVISSQQPYFEDLKLSEIKTEQFCSTPILIKGDGDTRVVITESDLESYPGMFLEKQSEYELHGKFAEFVLEEKPTKQRVCYPTKRADYLAKTIGERTYPWRVIVIEEDDKALLTNQLVYKLAPEATGDFSWVKPGVVAWDWWNALALYDVDFKAGINTDTYKYYIDFASEHGLEYVVVDDGWSENLDVTKCAEGIDIEWLSSYAQSKNVDLILWVSWVHFERQMDEAFKLYQKWGVKGLKIDFMNRDDQRMVDFYYRTARKAIEYKMLVNFHGAYKPTGWSRTFPHVLTSEGVAGLENHKWSDKITPKHNLTLPFNRMVAGPMDYTPGGMFNLHKKDFQIWFNTPATIGTRCHQLGMYVVYESPLQMLSDSPSNYKKEDGVMEFLSKVPVVWDETRVLEAKIGEYIVIARRSGDTWFLAGMSGDEAVDFDVNLDFIDGEKSMMIWEDGVNVEMQARDYKMSTKEVKKGDTVKVSMYNGGGYVAIIK